MSIGTPGTGKTALAATIAMASEFPFIKLISAENMVGFSEAQKIAHLNKVFSDSYKSPLSVIVVDGIERILGELFVGSLPIRFNFLQFVHCLRLGSNWSSFLERSPSSFDSTTR
jgi:hypothetical protein